jgi:hypothetical protein
MKNLIFYLAFSVLMLFVLAYSCTKVMEQENKEMGRPLYPQNPINPYVYVTNPSYNPKCLDCVYYVSGDTTIFKYNATGGQSWYGKPMKLTKLRVVYDNRIIKEELLFTKNYSGESIIATGSLGKHSFGITFWQEDQAASSQGFYVYKK